MDLSRSINFDIKYFFQWWGRGLAYWVPEKIKQLFSVRSGYVFLSVNDEVIQLKHIVEGQEKPIAQLVLNGATAEDFQQLILEHEILQKTKYILSLNPEQALKKILYLPLAAKENLRQVIAFEMDKYTPFNTDQVYFAVKLLGKEANGQIKVLLVLTAKQKLDSICQQLKTLQIYPDAVEYELAVNDYSSDLEPYNLLPEWAMPVKNKLTQLLSWGLGLVLLLLTTAVFVFPVWQASQTVESLRLQLKQLEKSSRLVQTQQLEIDGLIEETDLLIKVKKSVPSITALTEALSKLIPHDTWLTHLKFNDAQLQIQGQSPTASALIGLLEASPLFSNARFVSPLTQDKKTGKERFQISVNVNAQEVEDNG